MKRRNLITCKYCIFYYKAIPTYEKNNLISKTCRVKNKEITEFSKACKNFKLMKYSWCENNNYWVTAPVCFNRKVIKKDPICENCNTYQNVLSHFINQDIPNEIIIETIKEIPEREIHKRIIKQIKENKTDINNCNGNGLSQLKRKRKQIKENKKLSQLKRKRK
jgi:hypothetical protein